MGTARGRATFEEAEESEVDPARFRSWLAKIADRGLLRRSVRRLGLSRTRPGGTPETVRLGQLLAALERKYQVEAAIYAIEEPT